LGSKSVEVYDACPYCLTEIIVEKSSTINREKEKLEMKKTESERAKTHPKEKTVTQPPPKLQGCAHHFGYLGERSTKEKIPEECIVCEKIVQCMLKNVTG